MTEFDKDDVAIPGTYAIATVRLGGAMGDGTPVAFTEAAVCDVCGNWATEFCTSSETVKTNDDFVNARISRRVRVVVYACPNHYEQIQEQLCNEYGHASNFYHPDELTIAVDKDSRQRFAEQAD